MKAYSSNKDYQTFYIEKHLKCNTDVPATISSARDKAGKNTGMHLHPM